MVTQAQRDLVQEQLEDLHQRHLTIGTDDVVSFYPPDLEEARRHLFGVAGTHVDGKQWSVDDCGHRFPPALDVQGVHLRARPRGQRPRGDAAPRRGGALRRPVQLDHLRRTAEPPAQSDGQRGCLVAANLVRGRDRAEKVERLVDRLRIYAGNPELHVDEEMFAQEMVSNDRNLALSYLMRSLGMIDGDIEDNIVVYLSACSVQVTALELSTGGIVTALPNYFGLGLFSPGLDVHGNSVRGINLCRELSERFGLHVFADPTESRFGRVAQPAR